MIHRISAKRAEKLHQDVAECLEATHQGFDFLTEQLAEPLQAERYSSILTDIRGGILPALVVGGLARRWAGQTGNEPPHMIDLPGGKWWHQVNQEKYVAEASELTGDKRSLIVTEVIAGGEGSGIVYASLMDGGIAVDVAAFQAYCSTEEYYRRWRRPAKYHHLPIEDIEVYRGLTSAEGDLMNAPPLVLARSLEEDPQQFRSYQVTIEEQRFIMDVARKHLTELTSELYARHFPGV